MADQVLSHPGWLLLARRARAWLVEVIRTITAGTRCARYVVVTGGGSVPLSLNEFNVLRTVFAQMLKDVPAARTEVEGEQRAQSIH
jgi:hypothetical protein